MGAHIGGRRGQVQPLLVENFGTDIETFKSRNNSFAEILLPSQILKSKGKNKWLSGFLPSFRPKIEMTIRGCRLVGLL